MPFTMILEPLIESWFEEEELKQIKQRSDDIKTLLDEMKYGENITFETFIEKLQFTEDQYIQAIQYSLKRPTLLLKRAPSEIRISNYNTNLLQAWRANMDIQFVLDPYACAVYILSYITKGQRGMSKLLEQASKEANSGNKDIVNKVRHIGNKFLNAVEISAQEAVYLVLQMPLRRSTRDIQFINTSNPDERTFLLKTLDKIKELPDNSTDIESDVIKRYQRRPRQLQDYCLADFVAWFNGVKDSNLYGIVNDNHITDLPEIDFNDNFDDQPLESEESDFVDTVEIPMRGRMKLVKRQKPKIIRSVRYNKKKDPENYYREQIMLYCPWRNEEKDILNNCQTYQERYNQVETIVCKNKQQYEHHADILEQAIQDMDGVSDSAMTHPVAPVAQHNNEQDIATKSKPSELFGCFDPGTCKQHKEYDLFDDMGILPRTNDEEQLVQKHLNDNDCRKLVRSLNIEQKELFYHVLHAIKTDNDPLRLFLSGGVGVGKSTVTNALYEALSRNLSSVPGENPDEVKVLKVAPTGKAAFNIKGNTLHSAFKIPANRGYKYCALDADRLNTIRAQLRSLKIIFIDEISMVGNTTLIHIHQRLQQIFSTPNSELFSGISVIAVGDLYQLPPICRKPACI